MSATRKNKMGRRGMRKSFSIKVNTLTCAQCGQQVSKKKTKAVHITTQLAYARDKDMSMRKNRPTDNSAPRKRAGTPVVTGVRRVCSVSCQKG